jgi:hypothetical protein
MFVSLPNKGIYNLKDIFKTANNCDLLTAVVIKHMFSYLNYLHSKSLCVLRIIKDIANISKDKISNCVEIIFV